EILGRYSSLLWHIDNYEWSESSLAEHHDVFKNYLNLGGHILFSLYKPSEQLMHLKEYPGDFEQGSFMYDFLLITETNNAHNTWFSGAIPEPAAPVYLAIDSVKMPYFDHQIPFTEVLYPTANGEIMYLYDSKYDSSSSQGRFKYKPVIIRNAGPVKNIVTMGFPLYYIEEVRATSFVYHIMHDNFGEGQMGINSQNSGQNDSMFFVYPNPTNKWITIRSSLNKTSEVSISIYNLNGNLYENLYRGIQPAGENYNKFDIGSLPTGIYLLQFESNNLTWAKKLVVR
ncbi:MAG: T9SS type A sorting domain-containing protein, partial [Bacteroidales bacterium]|nr:T9SS type A sorting domain-containing protein [Bacteroidales bacterium]